MGREDVAIMSTRSSGSDPHANRSARRTPPGRSVSARGATRRPVRESDADRATVDRGTGDSHASAGSTMSRPSTTGGDAAPSSQLTDVYGSMRDRPCSRGRRPAGCGIRGAVRRQYPDRPGVRNRPWPDNRPTLQAVWRVSGGRIDRAKWPITTRLVGAMAPPTARSGEGSAARTVAPRTPGRRTGGCPTPNGTGPSGARPPRSVRARRAARGRSGRRPGGTGPVPAASGPGRRRE